MIADGVRQALSIVLTLIIVFLAAYVVHDFFICMLWAGVICIATMPLYQKWQSIMPCSKSLSAGLFTLLLAVVLILPLSWLIRDLVQETHLFVNTIQHLNAHGQPVPKALSSLPFVGDEISSYWTRNFSQADGVKHWLRSLQLSLSPLSQLVRQVGYSLMHRSVQLGFTLLTLFFFYRDGLSLAHQIETVGKKYLGLRWAHYANQLPEALRSAVNGSVVVGMGVGLVMGASYWLFGFAAPVLAGFFTAFAAMIPFVVPFVFSIVALMLFIGGSLFGALAILIIGTLVMFIADHLVKPALIGGRTQLPFLVVLFAILGGVETLGILGLFLGPIIMVMFMTLWRELQVSEP